MTQILAIIKPIGLPYLEDILADLDNFGERLIEKNVKNVPESLIRAHYACDGNLPWVEAMIQDLKNKDFYFTIYEGSQKDFLELKVQIREKYSDKIETIKDYQRNVIHISESESEFNATVPIWEKYLKQQVK